jgi:hypothetical protein
MISTNENLSLKSSLKVGRHLGGLVLFLGFIAWFAFILSSPPRIPEGDLIVFKDPGINFAQGAGLVERLSPSNHSLQPRFYSNYPPLYPALYGCYVAVAGVGAKANELFNFSWSALAAILYWYCMVPRNRSISSQWLWFSALFLTVALMPVGPFWTGRERPDALGFAIMLASLLALRQGSSGWWVFLAALIVGINSLISPFAFVMTCSVLGWMLIVGDSSASAFGELRKRGLFKLLSVLGLGIALPLASLFLVQWLCDPESVGRFAASATGRATGGTGGLGGFLKLLSGDFAGYFSGFSSYQSLSFKWRLAHLGFIALVVLGLLFRRLVRQKDVRIGVQFLAMFAFALFPMLVFPYQPYYVAMTAGMIPVLFAAFIPENDASRLRVMVASLAFLALLALPFTAREFIIARQSQSSYARMARTVADLRPAPGRPPLVVATSPSTYFFFKQPGFVVVEIGYLPPGSNTLDQFPEIDLFALSFNGLKIGAPRPQPAWWDATKLEPVYQPDIEAPTKLFGIPIYKGIASWEAEVFRRKK